MSVKTIEVWVCDNDKCGNIARYGALPDGWVWGMVSLTRQKADPVRRGKTVDVAYTDERAFCCEACAKAYAKDTGVTLERPKVAAHATA